MIDKKRRDGEVHGLTWSVAQRFMKGRADLSAESALLEEVNERRGTAVALGMADLSESIAVALESGMTETEVAAMLKIAHEYFADPDRPTGVLETVEGGFQ